MSLEVDQKNRITAIPFVCAAGTNVGKKRENNEDAFVFDAENGFFMVVDGMGGYKRGEVAAKIAAETIHLGIRKIEDAPADVRLRDSIVLANNAIFESAQTRSSEMGCVLTALLIENETATVGHIGDTRLYKISAEIIEKLTADHSFVGELETKGELSEKRLLEHPQRNEVTRCVGFEEIDLKVENFVDIFQTEFSPETAFLLCSDGLSDFLTTAQISKIVYENAADPEHLISKLIKKANDSGGKDNITTVFIAGKDFARRVYERNLLEKEGEKSRILTVLSNRWAFLIYGFILGFGFVFVYFYRIIMNEIKISIP